MYLWFQTLVLNKWITPFIGNFWLPVALKTDSMLIQILIAITIYVLLPMFTGTIMGNLTVWLYLEDMTKNAKNKEKKARLAELRKQIKEEKKKKNKK